MLFIFDWDGTISDSASKIVFCMQAAARDVGIEVLDEDPIKNIIGLGLSEAVQTMYPGVDADTEERLRKAYSAHFVEQDQVPSSFFPGVMDTLEHLRDSHYTLAVATGKSRRGLDRVLGNLKLDTFFHFSRCADETESKPSPLMLQQLVDEAGVGVSDAVMVGDTEWDMVMADNIGMKKIAVSYGAHSKQRLKACAPDMLTDDFSSIKKWRF